MSEGCIVLEPDTRLPHCQPLKTLQDVLSWKPSSEQLLCATSSANKTFVRATEARTKPYTLVCHDFKGGYLEDRYLQGGQKEDAYFFCRWEMIDIFVYFSHYFVTVPPLGWIRASHKHGTMMLGTIITEWEDGAVLWAEVLSSKETVQQLVKNLVAICTYHGFDGWLVNVENKIAKEHVEALTEFVKQLTEESHRRLPGSKVLWYDSVITTGELKWQDQLNENNSQFFDVCDGIFLNYNWTPEKLAASKDVAKLKNRPFDVFVGIDVHARDDAKKTSTGFNTREALEPVRKCSLSAAIFAPGWVLENLGSTEFDDNDFRFWSKLRDLFYPQAFSGLPLSSAFCQGHGNDFFGMGKGLSNKSWYNMSLQQTQPERTHAFGTAFGCEAQPSCLSLNTCLSSAYFGGCSLELSADLSKPPNAATFRLFNVKTELDRQLYCSYTFKENSSTPCEVYLTLTFSGVSERTTHRVILGPSSNPPSDLESRLFCDTVDQAKNSITTTYGDGLVTSLEEKGASGPAEKKARIEHLGAALYTIPLSGDELDKLKTRLWFHDLQETGRSRSEQTGWKTRHFRVDTSKLHASGSDSVTEKEHIVIAISLCQPEVASVPLDLSTSNNDDQERGDTDRVSVLLGHLQVFREQDLDLQAPTVRNIKLDVVQSVGSANVTSKTSDLKDENSGDGAIVPAQSTRERLGEKSSERPLYILRWDVEGEASVDYFNIYFSSGSSSSPCLAGHAAVPMYVYDIAEKFVHDDKVTVSVQPVLSATGLPLPLSKCTKATLAVPK